MLELSIFKLLGIGFGFDGLSAFWWRGGRGKEWQDFFPVKRERVCHFDNVLSQMNSGERWLV